jgi:two-component system cell cycle sensor histidine kinase/response regulator CckA
MILGILMGWTARRLHRTARERRSARQQRRASEERYRHLFESTPLPMWLYDPETLAFLAVNDAAIHHYGFTREEFLAMTVKDIRPEEDVPRLLGAVAGASASSYTPDAGLWRHRKKSGEAIDVQISSHDLVTDGRKGRLVVAMDVTHRQMLETQLEQERRVSSLGRLAATIAHEFNNVLMGIQPFAELVSKADVPKHVSTAAEQIKKSVQRGRQVTQGILRFTQPAESLLRPLELSSWLDEVLAEIRSLVGPGISVQMEIEDATLCILADAGQLSQVLMNLAANARDAMPAGGRFRIRVSAAGEEFSSLVNPREFVELVLSDTGSGMSPAVLEHIFDPLFTTKKAGGTGLGLAVVRQIVQRHGGKIFAESAPEKGTTFHLLLKRSAERPAAECLQEKVAALPPGRRILLVEDDPSVSAGIQALLEAEGLIVEIAESGGEAQERLDSFAPDAVVLDVGLPDMDGVEVYRNIHAKWPDLPIILSSGHGDITRIHEAVASTEVQFLQKPYSASDLFQVLQRYLPRSSE